MDMRIQQWLKEEYDFFFCGFTLSTDLVVGIQMDMTRQQWLKEEYNGIAEVFCGFSPSTDWVVGFQMDMPIKQWLEREYDGFVEAQKRNIYDGIVEICKN